MSTWLYQFHHFAFTAAQSWPQIPVLATDHSIGVKQDHSPGYRSSLNPSNLSLSPSTLEDQSDHLVPSQQCSRAVHMTDKLHYAMFGDSESDKDGSESDEEDIMDNEDVQGYRSSLHQALAENRFSNIAQDLLPIPMPGICQQTKLQNGSMIEETVAFAIMGRNTDLLYEALRELEGSAQRLEILHMYPFHMEAAYLDGGKTCCLVFDALCGMVDGIAPRKDQFVNEYGHSVLDALLLTILRSHTTVTMRMVDGDLLEGATMPGQEVDICGRWTADIPCFQALLRGGQTALPTSWKHKFCHTSFQAIIHSILLLLDEFPLLSIIPSGLFKHQCLECGQRFQLGPLHALVMTAFYLATFGRPGEDLIGIVACYLALVSAGVLPVAQCAIHPLQLLDMVHDVGCRHKEMSPFEMAVAIEAETDTVKLSETTRIGWSIFMAIMRIAEESCTAARESRCGLPEDAAAHNELYDRNLNVWETDRAEDAHYQGNDYGNSSPLFPKDCDVLCARFFCESTGSPRFGDSPILGHVWAALKAELATNKKIREDDGWSSASFSMEHLLASLTLGDSVEIGYMGFLAPYCRCGRFKSNVGVDFPKICSKKALRTSMALQIYWRGPHSLISSQWIVSPWYANSEAVTLHL